MDIRSMNLSELGELLIEIGKALKTFKEVKQEKAVKEKKEISKKRVEEETSAKLALFIESLSYLTRSDAEERLNSFTVKEIENLCKLVQIPFRPKQTKKEELIRKVLRHFYDFPEGRKALERFIAKSPEEITEFQEAKTFFEFHREQLLEQYEGKYIAILNGKVIDIDEDFSKLAERVYSKFGYKDIYMPKVEKKKVILNIPAPQRK